MGKTAKHLWTPSSNRLSAHFGNLIFDKGDMKNFLHTLLSASTHLLPSGMTIPIITGPLKGQKWIIGAAAGEGKGMSVIINKSEPEQVNYADTILKNSSICFDIGANVGFYTLLFSQRAKEVYAFEPLPRNLKYLIRLVEINKITNTKIIPCAVSESPGISYFSEGENPSLGKLNKDGKLPVLAISCDQFVKETKIIPDLLKIDVEGAELGVLKGAKNLLNSHHPSILLSIHGSRLRNDCLDFLKNINYQNIIPLNSAKWQEATEFAFHYTHP